MNAAKICGALFALACTSVSASSSAEPPVSAEDPRVDTLARLHAAFFTRLVTYDVFSHVSGPHADLCRLDLRDASDSIVGTRWYRFGERRWEVAYKNNGPSGGETLIHEVLDLDAAGRPASGSLVMTYANQPRKRIEGFRRHDWSPESGLASTTYSGRQTRYTVDPDDPDRLRVRQDSLERSVRVTPARVEMWDLGTERLRTRMSWREGGALDLLFDTGQSRVTTRHGVHGGVRSHTSKPLADYRGRVAPVTWSTERDDRGRLTAVDLGKNGLTAHLTYGCAWPAEFEEPAPPHEAGGAAGGEAGGETEPTNH